MNRLLVVDNSSVLHIAKYSILKEKKISESVKKSFIIHGFLARLRMLKKSTHARTVVFALDSRSSLRRDMYPRYKYKRKRKEKTEDEILLDELAYKQFNILNNEILKEIGYRNIFQFDGYEADDVIAKVCQQYPETEICIVSTDSDLYQLLTNNIAMFNPRTMSWFTSSMFRDKYNIDPKEWVNVKKYSGCTTDNVLGVPIYDFKNKEVPERTKRRIGEGYALKYMKNELNKNTNVYKSIKYAKSEWIIKRNIKLTKLPFHGIPSIDITQNELLSKKYFLDMCKKYDFKYMRQDIQEYARILNLR